MPDRKPPELASMSSFVDFALASGTSRITVVADHKRNRHSPVTDFYRPFRENLVNVHRHHLDAAAVFANLMLHTGDVRAQRLFPMLIAKHAEFLSAYPDLQWVEPVTAALAPGVGTGLCIAINPEVGFVIGGIPHHLKLYLRGETLSQQRVDFTIAAMAVALPVWRDERVAVLDLRGGPRIRYLSEKASTPQGWARISSLVNVEAAAYATAWGRA